jgi:hypothetical protein
MRILVSKLFFALIQLILKSAKKRYISALKFYCDLAYRAFLSRLITTILDASG